MAIHPTACVSPRAELDDGVEIGPRCVIEGPVQLGRGVRLVGDAYVMGPCRIGAGTVIYPFACLGFPPQDVKFAPGNPTAGVVIGRDCIVREHATVHAATRADRPTRVGDRVFIMVNAHVGHDAVVGDGAVLVNNSALGGFAELGPGATLSGGCLVHQFTRVGRLAFISGGLAVSMDVPPFCLVGERNRLVGLNLVGLRRAGLPREHITELRRAFRDVLRTTLPRPEMVRMLQERGRACPPVAELATFIAETRRAICHSAARPPRFFATFVNALRRGRLSLNDIIAEDNAETTEP